MNRAPGLGAELANDLAGRARLGELVCLSGPEVEAAGVAALARGRARSGEVAWWISGYATGAESSCSVMNLLTIPRASRPENARVRRVGIGSVSSSRCAWCGPGLGREHQRRPDLGGGRPGAQHGGDGGARRDPAAGDQRQRRRSARTSCRSASRPMPRGVLVVDERAAVAAGLGALDDQRVGAGGRAPWRPRPRW